MPVLLPKPIPRVSEVRDLFKLGPCVEPLDRDAADSLDRTSGHLAYRFFRDCEAAPFDRSSAGFSAVNAWVLADASLLAYADANLDAQTEASSERAAGWVTQQILPSVRRLFDAIAAKEGRPPSAELTVRTFVRASSAAGVPEPVQCYVVDDGLTGIVAFRGTMPRSFPNWLTDCEIRMVSPDPDADGILVHEGFWRAANLLWEDFGALSGLRTYLAARRTATPALRLWFTGHSFGAALATLSAYRLGHAHSLHTFGSPRVGNIHFANAFSRQGIPHYRVVHRHDIVPSMPVPVPFLEYEHVGELKYIESPLTDVAANAPAPPPALEGVALEVPPETVERPSPWETIFETVTHLGVVRVGSWLDHITDHSLIYYSRVLWNEFVGNPGGTADSERTTI